jgi:hypothetical protein
LFILKLNQFVSTKLQWYESAMSESNPLSKMLAPGATSPAGIDRRPIRWRKARWAQATASYLAGLGVRPNQISLTSALAAAVGALSLTLFSQPWNAIGCICGIQLRLLCNLLDGMVDTIFDSHCNLAGSVNHRAAESEKA